MAKNLEIDLHDPAVQNLLGNDGGIVAPDAVATGKRTLMRLDGDDDHVGMSQLNLDAGKSMVAVWYPRQELLLEIDVHAIVGAPIELLLICPKCRNALRITSERKQIAWDPRAENPMRREIQPRLPAHHQARALLGKISVEPFECTWEMNAKQAVAKDMTVTAGNLCRWRGAIDDNRIVEV